MTVFSLTFTSRQDIDKPAANRVARPATNR